MIRRVPVTALALLFAAPWVQADGHLMARAKEMARKFPIVDTHIDVPYRLQDSWEDVTRATRSGDFDYPRAKAGGLTVPFMSIYIPARYETTGGGGKLAHELIDSMEALVGRAPEKFAMAYSTADVEKNHAAGRISLAMGMENGTPVDGSLDNLRLFHERGVRYITLAHSRANHISDSSYDINRPWGGLSPFGVELVREMNRIGMIIDISHITDQAAAQALELSTAPVIASHSSARKFTPGWERNIGDDMIRAVGKNGGVVGINFGSTFVSPMARGYQEQLSKDREAFMAEQGISDWTDPRVTEFTNKYKEKAPFPYAKLEDVLDNFDHVVALAGIDHVGIGSDYDGVGDSLPENLKDVSTYPNLIHGLLQRGYSEQDIEKILYKNVMRVWAEVERVARSSAHAPSHEPQ